jgi:hypothetical protein
MHTPSWHGTNNLFLIKFVFCTIQEKYNGVVTVRNLLPFSFITIINEVFQL